MFSVQYFKRSEKLNYRHSNSDHKQFAKHELRSPNEQSVDKDETNLDKQDASTDKTGPSLLLATTVVNSGINPQRRGEIGQSDEKCGETLLNTQCHV